MGTVRPLFIEIVPKKFELPEGWQQQFEDLRDQAIALDGDAFEHIEAWLRCYVDMLHIAEHSAKTARVVRALKSLQSRVGKLQLGHSAARERSLRLALLRQECPQGEAQRAKNIALDYLAIALHCDRMDYIPTGRTHGGRRAITELEIFQLSDALLHRMQRHLASTIELLERTATENEIRFAKVRGQRFGGGKPFVYLADPHMAPYYRPDQDAINVLTAAMCVIYRYKGGTPYVPRDGRSENAFMKFLDAACKSLPRPRPSSICRTAGRMLRYERKIPGFLDSVLQRVVPQSGNQN
jgi:hypothetical protein